MLAWMLQVVTWHSHGTSVRGIVETDFFQNIIPLVKAHYHVWVSRTTTICTQVSIHRIHFSLDDICMHRRGLDDKNYITWLLCDYCKTWREWMCKLWTRIPTTLSMEVRVSVVATNWKTEYHRWHLSWLLLFASVRSNIFDSHRNDSDAYTGKCKHITSTSFAWRFKTCCLWASCEIVVDIQIHPTDAEETPIDTTEIDNWMSEQASNDHNVVFKCTF